MKRTVAVTFLLAFAGSASAQSVPFDMSTESVPNGGPRPTQTSPYSPPSPPAGVSRAPARDATPTALPRTAAAGPAPAAADPLRYLMPMDRLSLSGEIATRRWSIFLTEREAASARTLQLGYQSSILVAPEASRLTLSVNNQVVIDTPVQSPDAAGEISVAVPADLLKAGLNIVAFDTTLRHRTDCTIESTYDLWAEIDPERTFFRLDAGTQTFRALEDIRAIGSDAAGNTRYDIVLPAGRILQATAPTVRLSQALALLGLMPNQSVVVSEGVIPDGGPGVLSVVMGPFDEIGGLVPDLPGEASRAPFAGFRSDAEGRPVLVITGPAWSEVAAAVEIVAAPIDRPVALTRDRIVDPAYRTPDAPFVFTNATIPFSQLGIATQEFTGRRFRTEFSVGVPADFYADAYGEATILLDAAYTSSVLPSSRIDVYVNGNIATTLPIGSGDGAVLRQYPVPVTLRHFRPGANVVALEAVLETEADGVCLPGTTTSGDTRFALFDTSEFRMPSFARIGQRPDLVAFSGVGFPYNRSETPIPLVLGDASALTLSATATLLQRVAQVAGRPVPFDTSLSAAGATGKDALFIGPATRFPNGVLAQVGVSEAVRSSWEQGVPGALVAEPQTSIDRWQSRVGQPWQRPFLLVEDWLQSRFDISADALRLTTVEIPPFMPSTDSSFFMAQGRDPGDDHTWTAVAGRSPEELAEGVARMTRADNWSELSGRLTLYDPTAQSYEQLPAVNSRLVSSVPASFTNLRLVAANWLSENALAYAIILALGSIVLGIATSAITTVLGRRK